MIWKKSWLRSKNNQKKPKKIRKPMIKKKNQQKLSWKSDPAKLHMVIQLSIRELSINKETQYL